MKNVMSNLHCIFLSIFLFCALLKVSPIISFSIFRVIVMDLSKLPGNLCKINKKTLRDIEKERSVFWEKFFKHIEESYDADGATEGIHEIDDPNIVCNRVGGFCEEMPVSETVRRWFQEHEDYIEELTTIAGPPAEDEEDIGEEIFEENESGEEENGNEEDIIGETYSQTDDEERETEKLDCVSCGRKTIYSLDITEDEETFQCDVCLLGLHPECEVECQYCKDIAAKVERRWAMMGLDLATALKL